MGRVSVYVCVHESVGIRARGLWVSTYGGEIHKCSAQDAYVDMEAGIRGMCVCPICVSVGWGGVDVQVWTYMHGAGILVCVHVGKVRDMYVYAGVGVDVNVGCAGEYRDVCVCVCAEGICICI